MSRISPLRRVRNKKGETGAKRRSSRAAGAGRRRLSRHANGRDTPPGEPDGPRPAPGEGVQDRSGRGGPARDGPARSGGPGACARSCAAAAAAVNTHTHARMHTRTHTRTHARTHTRTHARTHAPTHTLHGKRSARARPDSQACGPRTPRPEAPNRPTQARACTVWAPRCLGSEAGTLFGFQRRRKRPAGRRAGFCA